MADILLSKISISKKFRYSTITDDGGTPIIIPLCRRDFICFFDTVRAETQLKSIYYTEM